MARVVAFIPDLLFGSRVQAGLLADGHTVELVGDPGALGKALVGSRVLIVDLTDDVPARIGFVESLSVAGSLTGISTLAFYSHIEADVREMAESAGFDLVVPRSRMAREGESLIKRLVVTS